MADPNPFLRPWAPVLLVLLVMLVYIRTLDAPFVWDDRYLVLESPAVTTIQPLAGYFRRPFWSDVAAGDLRVYYRPLTVLSLALDYRVHGPNPTGFHLTNLLLHTVNALLLYLLLRRYRVTPGVALALGLAWGWLPRLTEAVAWVAGRTDVLATTFVMIALMVHRPGHRARLVLASAIVFLGMLCKEVALAGALTLAALEALAHRSGRPLAARLAHASLPLVAAAAYLLLRHIALPAAPPVTSVSELTATDRALLVPSALGTIARMLAVPWWPELQIGSVRDPGRFAAACGAAILVAAALLAWRFKHLWIVARNNVQPLVVTGSTLAVASVGLVLHVIPLSLNVVSADRFLYVPSLGLAVMFAPAVQTWARRSPARLLPFAGVALSFAVATCVRVGDWCDEARLWSKTFHQTPRDNPLPANELGNLYFRAGLFRHAIALYREAEKTGPTGIAAANIASALAQSGAYDTAGSIAREQCARYTFGPKACLDAGLIELHQLHLDASRSLIEEAIARAGDYEAARAALALIPRVQQAMQTAGYAAQDPVARFRVAMLAGRRPEALALAEAILATRASPPEARREAAEYCVRFAPPTELPRLIGSQGPAADVVDSAMIEAASLRVRTAEHLLAVWPSLSVSLE